MTKTWTRTLIGHKLRRCLCLAGALLPFLLIGTATAAAADDFSQIVNEVEARYHVHRNYRFLMGLAGMTVRMTHIAGARDLRAALFADQHFDATGDELDALLWSVGAHDWQPLVRSFDRRSGEHTFIYARHQGRDLRVLLVTVEPNEGVVLEVTVNQQKLLEFIDRHQHYGTHSARNHGDDQGFAAHRADAGELAANTRRQDELSGFSESELATSKFMGSGSSACARPR